MQSRKNCLLLLLVLTLSHAALTLHVSSHVAADQQNCQICAQHSNLAHAIPPAAATPWLPAGDAPETFTETTSLRAHLVTPYHQRAPPHDA
ncbi:MAG: hypothetical protein ACREQ8_09020 [Woeseiaceae bacterium]